jgi:hypothetical protein
MFELAKPFPALATIGATSHRSNSNRVAMATHS